MVFCVEAHGIVINGVHYDAPERYELGGRHYANQSVFEKRRSKSPSLMLFGNGKPSQNRNRQLSWSLRALDRPRDMVPMNDPGAQGVIADNVMIFVGYHECTGIALRLIIQGHIL